MEHQENLPQRSPADRIAAVRGYDEPGRCQVCGEFRLLSQYWPSTMPARYVDLCDQCQKLGDLEIARRLPFTWRSDGASV